MTEHRREAAARKFFLAIRHKPSGGFLPQMTSYGFTRASPSTTEPPRLFVKPGAATQALNRWLEGEWFEGHFDEEANRQDIRIVRRPERKRSEMEIVEIEITTRTLSEADLRKL